MALDRATAGEALALADRLRGVVHWFKVGMELYTAEGPAIVRALLERQARIFLDLKFHDIPNTVERACAASAALGCGLINVHAGGGPEMMAAAARGAREGAAAVGRPAPGVLAVTVLTSLTGEELPGYYAPQPVGERVHYLATAAREAGLDGVVCSPRESARLRAALGPDFILLTPGIRFADGDAGDQKRIATPGAARRDGSDYLVMGRPITDAADPAAAARRAIAEMASAAR